MFGLAWRAPGGLSAIRTESVFAQQPRTVNHSELEMAKNGREGDVTNPVLDERIDDNALTKSAVTSHLSAITFLNSRFFVQVIRSTFV